ncbi:MAG TPA: glycosyltransferase, partial [Actinomycetota bacterium]|nr:glycosyltransferase [Actinomycetota bacterium]
PAELDEAVARALAARDAGALDRLAASYDQDAPDPGAAGRLRALAASPDPLVGYLGKLIPAKGVDRFLLALAGVPEARGLVVGFGTGREWLTALVLALEEGDARALGWLRERGVGGGAVGGLPERAAGVGAGAPRFRERVAFTGRLEHRDVPDVLAALDVLVVPSTLPEAFGMVAAEGAAAGAIPLVARHSGLAEAAEALEAAAGTPGLCSFEPEAGAEGIARGIRRILGLPPAERRRIRGALAAFVAREWTWARTTERLLEAALGRPGERWRG